VVRVDKMPGSVDGKINVRLSIIDQDIGIAEETISKLFSAFSQAESSTTRRFGGTGLGLAICRRLIDLMGGEINVKSTIGSGSTFYVDLSLKAVEDTSAAVEQPDLSGLRVLCVSDSDMLNMTMKSYLEHWSAETQCVSTEDEAVIATNEAAAPFEIVVLDCGFDSARQKEAVTRLARDGLTFVMLSERQRRTARLESDDTVSLDANPLRHYAFINAVSVAAGRASPLVGPNVDEDTAQEVKAPSVEEALDQGILILLAEDNLTNQQVIGRQLTKLGYACEIADDGKLALEAWRKKPYGLLLTDCHMPNMDGFELTAALRADESGTDKRAPIIAVTANALAGEAERCIAGGMDDYLSKPLAMSDLKATLQKWMPQATPAKVQKPVVQNNDEKETDAEQVDAVETSSQKAVEPTYLRETFGDDDEMIGEILKDYIAPARSAVDEIDVAFGDRDLKGVGAAAHKLKSASRSVGADFLADLCAELEKSGKADDWDTVQQLHPKLASTYAEVDKAIEEF
jgi:CheY-like chemotaxis protein/HPt (histidine-containing phosphotransfer) domain-containing protein